MQSSIDTACIVFIHHRGSTLNPGRLVYVIRLSAYALNGGGDQNNIVMIPSYLRRCHELTTRCYFFIFFVLRPFTGRFVL